MSKQKKKTKITRRKVMQASGLALCGTVFESPLQMLLKSLMSGICADAYAQEAGVKARNYVFIQLFGAPARWGWDPLAPFDEDSRLIKTAQVGNRYVNGSRYTATEYVSTKIKGINMPWLWRYAVPKAGGGERPLSDLMDDFLIMRGVNCGNGTHAGAANLQFFPLGMKNSITSLASDHSDRPIPYVGMDLRDDGFSSALGKTGVKLPTSGNMLINLLKPFDSKASADFIANKNKLDAQIRDLASAFSKLSVENHPGAKHLIESRKDTEELLRGGFNGLTTEYNSRVAKYRDLIAKAANPKSGLAQLTDRHISSGNDLRDSYKASTMYAMANYFAVTEYILINKLSSSVSFRGRGVAAFDEHSLNNLQSVLANTLFNRAMGACLLELRDVLIRANEWKETLIGVSGEFGRNPKNSPTGSDHCPEAGSITLLSGALKGRQVVGNIVRDGSKARGARNGTYGFQASNPGVGVLTSGHLANSIAQILRTPLPLTAVDGLMKEDRQTGELSCILPGGKIIG